MGITGNTARFILAARQKYNVSFESTLMLGRQQLFIDSRQANILADRFNVPLELLTDTGTFSEPFFAMLGAKLVDSMDYSAFEKATIIHDLNVPVSDSLKNKYSAVFDGGTLEHVFNFPTAIKNCMDMIAVGGHFISITPTNNFCGHGFYQFSPELFFTLFNEDHGFQIDRIVLEVEHSSGDKSEWYEIEDSNKVKRRVTLCNSSPSSILLIARKTKETATVSLRPFQSDYAHIWSVHESLHQGKHRVDENRWIHYYRMWIPEFVKRKIRTMVNRKLDKQEIVEGLGTVNPEFFKKVDL